MYKLSSLLWIVPFISFASGYFFLSLWFWQQPIKTPNIIGYSLHEAATTLAEHQLNLRIIGYKEESDINPGTIINQIPQANHSIRANQPVFCLISKSVQKKSAPSCVGKLLPEIARELEKNNVSFLAYPLISTQSKNTIIGQSPKPGIALRNEPLILYYAACESTISIMPNFKHCSIDQAHDIISNHAALKLQTIHATPQPLGHQCINCVVIDQKPNEGSFIDLSSGCMVQLLLE